MGKPDALTHRTGEEKAGAEEKIFEDGQLNIQELEVLVMDGIKAEEVADTQLEGLDCTGWGRDLSGLLKVPKEY